MVKVDKRFSKNFKEKEKGSKKPFISRRQSKLNLKEKRARLIVKNLPFSATDESIREHFEKYGKISDIEVLKKPDGKLVGCAFIQYSLVQFAKKAQHHTNKEPFLGRKIKVDFAQSKNKFDKEKSKEIEIKTEIKEEEEDNIKEEENSSEIDPPKDTIPVDLEESDTEEVLSEKSDNNNSKKSFESHDVSEGKTIFIKNVPFEATNEELKECMSQFGQLYYALICIDKFTEHSRGTAFVKFVNKEDAEKALTAGTELTIKGNILDCHPAIDRHELKNKEKEKKELDSKPRDSRNLYLVKEGVILAGTKAAEGVSAADMAKRLQIEQYKTQMLRNLNTFVSRERLVIHNLPATWDDTKLKMLFQNHGGKNAVVKEARVMRDLRKLDAQGVGETKRFGFVAFYTHEHALNALRSLNNNPNVFTPSQRPILCFSIESKTALKAKLKRQERSILKNPIKQHLDSSNKKRKRNKNLKNIPVENNLEDVNNKSFTGITAKEGVIQKMRSRYKLSEQAKLHHETLKKEKKNKKMAKKTLNEKKKDFIKQPKQKINKKSDNDRFSKLVNDYKRKLETQAVNIVEKSKWYNE